MSQRAAYRATGIPGKIPADLRSIRVFFQGRLGRIVSGIAALMLAYIVAGWAIDSGRLLAWSLAILLLAGGMNRLITAVRGTH